MYIEGFSERFLLYLQAAKLFVRLLLHKEPRILGGIPEREKVISRLPSPFNPAVFQWKTESETFPVFTSLLSLPPYRDRVILGLVVSVGGLTERLVKFSSAALFSHLREADRPGMDDFCQGLLAVFKSNEVCSTGIVNSQEFCL